MCLEAVDGLIWVCTVVCNDLFVPVFRIFVVAGSLHECLSNKLMLSLELGNYS